MAVGARTLLVYCCISSHGSPLDLCDVTKVFYRLPKNRVKELIYITMYALAIHYLLVIRFVLTRCCASLLLFAVIVTFVKFFIFP